MSVVGLKNATDVWAFMVSERAIMTAGGATKLVTEREATVAIDIKRNAVFNLMTGRLSE